MMTKLPALEFFVGFVFFSFMVVYLFDAEKHLICHD